MVTGDHPGTAEAIAQEVGASSVLKYFSLYSVNVQCEGFAKLTFVFFFSFDETKENVHEVVLDPLKLLNEKCPRVAVR